jgi:hypothetical protein
MHFAGTISPRAERKLRFHLAECASCRDEYEKYLVLAEIDPAALSAEERIGRGLGVRSRPARIAVPLLASAATVCAVALALAFPLGVGDPGVADEGFAPRGAVQASDELVVYRIRAGEKPERAPRRMRRTDELAFAFTNPSGFAYLMVFGVDLENRVHWYHPAWSDPNAAPRAIPIAKGAALHELPEAIAHELKGPTLHLFAVFSNEPFDVREIEGSLAADEPGSPEVMLPGVLVRRFRIEVE